MFIGLGLGWFRYFRLGNAVYASDNLDADLRSDTGFLISLVFILIFLALITILFVPTPLSSFEKLLKQGDWPQLKFSQYNFSYLIVGIICGEVFRWLHILEDEDANTDPSESFREFIHRFRPSVFARDNLAQDLNFESRAGIDVCCWAYGADPNVKLRLVMSIGRDFQINRSHRAYVLSEMDRCLSKRGALPKSVKILNRQFGRGSEANRDFLQKVAQVGKRSGYALHDIQYLLKPVAYSLGLPQDVFNVVLSRAGQIQSEHHYANQEKTYQQDRYWKEPDNAAQHMPRPAVSSERTRYLKVLGLAPGATDNNIHIAYRQLAMTYDPSRIPQKPANAAQHTRMNQKMSQINMAYNWLMTTG